MDKKREEKYKFCKGWYCNFCFSMPCTRDKKGGQKEGKMKVEETEKLEKDFESL